MNSLDVAYELDDLGIDLQDVFDFLDDIRKAGTLNIFGAAQYIQVQFGTSIDVSNKLQSLWLLVSKGGIV